MPGKPITFELEGTRRLAAQLDGIARRVRKQAMLDAVGDGAEILRDEASRLAPRRTGALAENIIKRVEWERAQAVGRVGPSREVFYGRFVELGEGPGNRTPQPFLRPAFDTKKPQIMAAMSARLKLEIMQAVRRAR